MTRTIIASLLSAALAAGGAWKYQANHYEKVIGDINLSYSRRDFRLLENAHANLIQHQKKAATAQSRAETQLANANSRYRDLVTVNNGLRDDIERNSAALSGSTTDSINQYTTTLGIIYSDCRAALSQMGFNAQGHAIDTQKLINTWPTKRD